MPKITKHPGLRTRVRKGRAGQVYVYYFFDDGEREHSLGSDHELALRKWQELALRKPSIAGKVLEAMEMWERDVLPTYESRETRAGYQRQLNRIKPVFGPATWDAVEMPDLVTYLESRTAKTQANREMAVFSIVWNYARKKGLTKLPFPAAGMERSKWKNREKARRFEVTDALFEAVYQQADEVLRAAMDVSTATGLRVHDTLAVPLGTDEDVLRHVARKTGKAVEFDLSGSDTLQRVVAWRKGIRAPHLLLLTAADGSRLTYRMLYDRYCKAREAAAIAAEKVGQQQLADAIRKMILRDMRKRAADLAEDSAAASKLLQHSSQRLTEAHYRTRGDRIKPVR